MKFKTVSKIDKFKVLLIALLPIIFLQRPTASHAETIQSEQAPWQEILTLMEIKPDKVFSRALQTAQSTTNASEKAWALGSVAESFANAGQTDKALEVFSQALQTAQSITDAWQKAWALRSVAESFAQAGQYEQALQTAQSITDPGQKAWALSGIAESFAKAGQYEQALQTAQSITHPGWKANALGSVAESFANAGQTDKALEVFSQALQTAQSITHPGQKARALADIAESFANAGQTDKALEVFSQALQTAQSITDAGKKAWWALSWIAKSFANAGQTDKALEVFSQALQTAQSITDAKQKAWALFGIAESFARAGQYEQALQTAQSITDAKQKGAILGSVAESFARAGQYEQALQTAQTITDAGKKAWALGSVAESFAKAGQYEQALQIANKITSAGPKANALGSAAESFAKAWQTSVKLSVDMKAPELLDDDKLYGIYAKNYCQSPAYVIYFLKDVQLFISKDYAEMQHSISVRKTRSSLIQQWKVKETGYKVMYFQLDKSLLKLFTAGTFDREQNLHAFPDNPPQGLLPVEFNKCEDIPPELSFIHAEGITFMKSLDDISIKCEKEKDKCLEYIFSMVDISRDNKLSKAEISRIFRIITYIAVVSGKEGEAKTEDITGISAIVSIISPSVAGAIIAGSDYDNDGQLSLEEMFYDRDISSAARTVEKFSFDVVVSFFIKAFGALSSILKFIP